MLILSVLLAASGPSLADVPPPRGYVETCTVAIQCGADDAGQLWQRLARRARGVRGPGGGGLHPHVQDLGRLLLGGGVLQAASARRGGRGARQGGQPPVRLRGHLAGGERGVAVSPRPGRPRPPACLPDGSPHAVSAAAAPPRRLRPERGRGLPRPVQRRAAPPGRVPRPSWPSACERRSRTPMCATCCRCCSTRPRTAPCWARCARRPGSTA